MDNLYDIDLFSTKIKIDNDIYGVLLQSLICIQGNQYANILILRDERDPGSNRLILTACDIQKHSIMPIPYNLMQHITNSLKQIPFGDAIQTIINEIKNVECKILTHPQKVELTKNVQAIVGPESNISRSIQLELEVLANLRLTPCNFVFGAFDGINTYLYFELEDKYFENIRNWGILSGATVYVDNVSMGDYFPGEVNKVDESKLSFLCQTKVSSILGTKIMRGLRIENLNMYGVSDFIVSSAGLFNSVSYPENYPKMQNWYTVIIPVIGLSIDNEFGIGSVQFFHKDNQEIKRIVSFEKEFLSYSTFALVHINNEKMFMAFMAAKRQIEQAIDLIVNILKDDSIFSIHSAGKHLINRNISIFEDKVSLSSLVYIDAPYTNARLACNLSKFENKTDLLVSGQFLLQKDELEKAELLLIKANGTNDKEITPLFNSLKWIRKAWDTDDFDDKIINAIIALEFIVSKEKNVPMMDKAIRKKCKNAISEIIQESENTPASKEDYSKKVLEKFDRTYTETPFMLKLCNLIDRLNIPISIDDMSLISQARDRRNGIIHGENDTQLPTDDIYRLCECISKIAFYKIRSLEV